MNNSMEYRLDLWRCFRVVWKNASIIIISGIIGLLAATLATLGRSADTYSATTTVYSIVENGTSLSQLQETTSTMQRYIDVAKSKKVLDRAVKLINDDKITYRRLSAMIEIKYQKDSSILRFVAQSSSPSTAISASNAVASAFVSEITSITGRNNAQLLDIATDYVVEQTAFRVKLLTRTLGFLVGAMLCTVAIVVLDLFTSKVHSDTMASLGGELNIIGTIPQCSHPVRRSVNEQK